VKEKHKDNSHKASFGNSVLKKPLFLPYTTKKSKKVIRTRKTIPINNKVARKPIKVITLTEIK
jgi:hypothetical protein